MEMPPLALMVAVSLTALVILVIYYVFLVRAILEMLRRDSHIVLLVFAFLALCPLPPCLVMGVLVILIWHFHKQTLPARADT
jgi:hypothetical protein